MRLVVALLLPLLSVLSRLHAQEITSTTEMERQIFELTNQERAKVNAPPLKWNTRLQLAARLHSDAMAQHHDLSHQVQGEPVFTERMSDQGAHFSSAAENVGYADDAETLQSGWMHSPPHRKNLLNPAYTEMGVGIVRSGNQLWATEDFATIMPGYSAEDFEAKIESRISALRHNRGLAPLTARSSQELRSIACSGTTSAGAAFAGSPRNTSGYAFNFTLPSPEQIPNDVVQHALELPTGSYTIGACAQAVNNGLTTYRVLMVLRH